jgi:hypothetical protein
VSVVNILPSSTDLNGNQAANRLRRSNNAPSTVANEHVAIDNKSWTYASAALMLGGYPHGRTGHRRVQGRG